MSRIYIRGLKSKRLIKLYRLAVKEMIRYLMGDRLDLKISLHFKDLVNTDMSWGMCWSDEGQRPRSFTVALDHTLTPMKSLRTLAHELVHVRQYARGHLYDYKDGERVRWKREIINIKDIEHGGKEYYNLPYEREANELEVSTVKWFLESQQLKLKDFR